MGNSAIVQFMVLRLKDSRESRDSKTPKTLRLPTPPGNMMSHTGEKLPMLGYAAGTGVATTLKAVQRQCDFISV